MLPVADVLPELLSALQQQPAVILSAPPGAGKSTYLPLYLLQQPALAGKRILLLEPRRLAARSIASYLAQQLDEPLGQSVGYQIRHEQCSSAATRLLVVTEGILTRKIQQDPQLSAVDILIFDEFHERSLHADLALALAREVQQLREDLRILVMSATLDVSALQHYLQAPVISSAGRSYPVDIHYLPLTKEPVALQAARQAWLAQQQHQGNVLVFLPGQAEIHQAFTYLQQQALPDQVRVHPLIGSMTLAEQQAAIAPAAAGFYKIVLATNLAETSLTIEGINVVVDSGLARRASYHARSGANRLETVAISQAAAEQRAGRAGRLMPGHCYRFDSAERWQRRAQFEPAEISLSDLTALRLEVAAWGCLPSDIDWLTAPAAANLAAASQLLTELQVLDAQGKITEFGRKLYQLGLEPRLASMLLYAKQLEAGPQAEPGVAWLACLCAAVLEDGRLNGGDLYQLVQRLGQQRAPAMQWQQAQHYAKRLGVKAGQQLPLQLLPLLILRAYPERLAQRRGQGYLMANGVGASLPPDHPLQGQAYLVVVQLQQTTQPLAAPAQGSRISQALKIELEQVQADWPAAQQWQLHCGWDEQAGGFSSEQRQCFGQLVLQRRPAKVQLSQAEKQLAWLEYIERKGLAVLPFGEKEQQLLARVALMRQYLPGADWPDLSANALLQNLAVWLGPHLGEINKQAQLAQLPLAELLWQQLNYRQQQQLQQQLPLRWQTPAGSSVSIDYQHPAGPRIAVRVQEMYGQLNSPQLLDGKLALTLELLSPGRQPLQITRDLASFWQHGWQEVKKEMKGRYPKHFWPDDPSSAQATSKTKKAMQR
ncbi:ATP-dependent helicase HrpB [Arsukibacterium sp.]|uniref:ATP-dependent helicase HrpB n=1 Tax=Arsukibacterium sp. TaxID=1977258 RepID=UPI002FD98660